MNQGKQGYLIIAGILLLDLLYFAGGASWATLTLLAAISLPLILLTFNLDKKNKALVSAQISTETSETDDKSNSSEEIAGEKSRQTREEDCKSMDISETALLLVSNAQSGKSSIVPHLDNWGASYTTVQSSARAFAALVESSLNKKPYQTVLVDQANLDMDDCQFAIALRAEPLLQPLYLIHYGGSVIPTRVEQLHTAGYSKVLSRPLDKTLLYNALHSAKEIPAHHHNVVQLLDHYQSDKRQQPLEILIASNNNNDSNKLRRILTAAGHQTFLITEGTQILDALDSHHFDLAILDADLPDISGIEVIKLYRFTHLNQPWVPFIVALENPNSQTIQACENADISNLIVKPIATQKLHSIIEEAIKLEQDKNEAFDYHASTGRMPYQNDDLTLDTHQLEELKRLGKEKSFLLDLVNQFDKESDELVKDLKHAILRKNIKSVQDFGHKLKDTAGNLGALNLYRLAVRATRITTSTTSLDLDNLVTEIDNCRISTIQALLDHLSKGNNSAYRKE